MLSLYNTLTRKKEAFKPVSAEASPGRPIPVGLYTCGPTVYNFAHIGNLRTYVFEDILKRVLLANKYEVNHVMNITDVGHLTNDSDDGEDKMEKGARREGKTAWDIAEFYTKKFKENLADLHIIEPTTWCKATDHIPEQITLVQKLIDGGHTYITHDGIYFDTTTIDDYGKLANLSNQELKAGERVDMGEKKNPTDFALWKFSPEGEDRQMEWEAFGKMGFPGWHVECSAMSMKYLGEQFDIHCGGIDHVPIHHSNEIAQTEAITHKKPWVNYWMHGEFLVLGKDKMAKSGDNFITLDTLKERGINPLAYRYFLLQAHYRKQLNFSWEALEAAQTGLERLYKTVLNWKEDAKIGCAEYEEKFLNIINDDLNTPEALALTWDLVKSDYPDSAKKATLLKFDKILGLGLSDIKEKEQIDIPANVRSLLDARQIAREAKDFEKSDELRNEIKKIGYDVEDTSEGQKITKTNI